MKNQIIISFLTFALMLSILQACINKSGTSQGDENTWMPEIINMDNTSERYLPDFSYAGYHFGEKELPVLTDAKVFNILDFGAVAGDEKDDSDAIKAALEAADKVDGSVEIRFPSGRFVIKKPVYITRSNTVLKGAGSDENGTVIYFPIPMDQLTVPDPLKELQEYLVKFNKFQKTNDLGEKIEPILFSPYSWSGGFLWFTVEGVRVKKYMSEYDVPPKVLANLKNGLRGEYKITAELPIELKVGDLVEIQWYNKEGKNSSLLKHIYVDTVDLVIGSHHWTNPDRTLLTQQVLITEIDGDQITIKAPLLLDIRPEWTPVIAPWEYIEESGIEGFRMEFPFTPVKPHHVEEGFNAVYFTRTFNGWAKDILFHNADNGILTEEACNLTIRDITTTGERLAHYSVVVSGSHNILVEDLEVYNPVRHALSFNTLATRSVFTNCKIYETAMLDQHSGLNHQNLFDNILLVDSSVTDDVNELRVFQEGGAKYWKPTHAPFSTFWNIHLDFANAGTSMDTVRINPVLAGPRANLVGLYGNRPIQLDYAPDAYMEGINDPSIGIGSLYKYQLKNRLEN
jgi:hypothetical protein